MGLLFVLSCGQVEEGIYDPEFNVYAMLYSWKPLHEIIVDRTYRMDELSQQYVDDAAVILSTTGFRDSLVFYPTTETYVSTPHDLQPGATYELLVAKEGLDTLYGSTTVPGDFIILNASLDTLILTDSITFLSSTGCAIYEITVLEITTFLTYHTYYAPDPHDTIAVMLGDIVYTIPSSIYEIGITALDSNYYHYYFEPPDSIHTAGVSGGVGMFGSSWTVSKQFYIVTEQ